MEAGGWRLEEEDGSLEMKEGGWWTGDISLNMEDAETRMSDGWCRTQDREWRMKDGIWRMEEIGQGVGDE